MSTTRHISSTQVLCFQYPMTHMTGDDGLTPLSALRAHARTHTRIGDLYGKPVITRHTRHIRHGEGALWTSI